MKIKNLLFILTIGILIFGTTSLVGATLIEILQGGSVLGSITPYTGTESAVDNYVAHGQPINGPATDPYEGQIYFYENSDGLYLNMHFGTITGDSTGINQHVSWDVTVAGSTTNPVMIKSDDPGEFYETATDNLFYGRWHYDIGWGDGGVLGTVSGNDWEITIDPVSYGTEGNITSLFAYSDSSPALGLDLDLTKNIVLYISTASVPEPASCLLLLFCLAGLIGVKKFS